METSTTKEVVIVFDNVWSVNAWETIKYAFCNCSSRVIFTTRLSKLPESIDSTRHVYQLQPLPEKEAWTVFENNINHILKSYLTV